MARRDGKVVVSEHHWVDEFAGIATLTAVPAVIAGVITWVFSSTVSPFLVGALTYAFVFALFGGLNLFRVFDDVGQGEVDADGFRDGTWVWMDKVGNVLRETDYEHGLRNGAYRHYAADGKLVYESHFRNDYLEPMERIWDDAGHLIVESPYHDGERHGTASVWDENGLTLTAGFDNGLPHGKWTWFGEKESPWVTIEFSYGAPHGEWKEFDEEGEVIRRSEFVGGIQKALRGRFESATDRYYGALESMSPPIPETSTYKRVVGSLIFAALALMFVRDALVAIPIAAFLFIIGIHEFGHLAAAKMVGIPIQKFRIGIGPRLLGFQWGQTYYELAVIPLMGYVLPYTLRKSELAASRRLTAQQPLHEARPDEPAVSSPELVSWWRRMVFFLGGVFVNFLLAVVILWSMGDLAPEGVRSSGPLDASYRISQTMVVFAQATPRILYSIMTFENLRTEETERGAIAVIRDQAKEAIDSAKEASDENNDEAELERARQQARQRLANLLIMFCFMNVAVVWFNLLPIPPLDGFQVLIGTLESATGKPWRRRLATPLMIIGGLFIVTLLVSGSVSIFQDLETILWKK